jgi:hypothetical protein
MKSGDAFILDVLRIVPSLCKARNQGKVAHTFVEVRG